MSDVRLEIALSGSSRFKVNEPIVLKAWVTNISPHIIKIISTHILREYEIRVMFENGQPVAMTTHGHQLMGSVRSSETFQRMVIDLDPGGVYQLDAGIKLNEWFQLDRPDAYIVHIQQRRIEEDQQMPASNLVTFIIESNL